MGRITNYCEVAFLEKLFAEVPDLLSFLDNDATIKNWQLILDLIYSKSILVFSNIDEITQKT